MHHRRLHTGAQFYCGDEDLTQPLVRNGRYGGGVGTLRTKRPHHGLWCHFEPATHDHVGGAAVDVEEIVGVEVRQIACGHPDSAPPACAVAA